MADGVKNHVPGNISSRIMSIHHSMDNLPTPDMYSSSPNTSGGSNDGGPYYVVMVPTGADGLNQRRKIPSSDFAAAAADLSTNRGHGRDEKRRATHNEVERRRRDKINNWITKLAKLVPDCSGDHTKHGQSKGGILAKACDYINDLVGQNHRLQVALKEKDFSVDEIRRLREELAETKSENRRLHAIIAKEMILENAKEAVHVPYKSDTKSSPLSVIDTTQQSATKPDVMS